MGAGAAADDEDADYEDKEDDAKGRGYACDEGFVDMRS